MNLLPLDVVNNILMFNPEHRILFNRCLNQLCQREMKKKLINDIHHMKYGPLYSIPRILKVTNNMYTLLLIIRSN